MLIRTYACTHRLPISSMVMIWLVSWLVVLWGFAPRVWGLSPSILTSRPRCNAAPESNTQPLSSSSEPWSPIVSTLEIQLDLHKCQSSHGVFWQCSWVWQISCFLTFYPGIMTPIYPKYSQVNPCSLGSWHHPYFQSPATSRVVPGGVQRAMAHEMHACASSTRSCAVGQGCGWRMRWSNKIWVDKNVLRRCEGWNSGQYFRTIRFF